MFSLTAAWKDFKGMLAKLDPILIAAVPEAENAINVGVGIASAIDPAAAPILTVADKLEESVMGELLGIFSAGTAVVNASTGEAAVTLSAPLSSAIKALVGTLTTKIVVPPATPAPAPIA